MVCFRVYRGIPGCFWKAYIYNVRFPGHCPEASKKNVESWRCKNVRDGGPPPPLSRQESSIATEVTSYYTPPPPQLFPTHLYEKTAFTERATQQRDRRWARCSLKESNAVCPTCRDSFPTQDSRNQSASSQFAILGFVRVSHSQRFGRTWQCDITF